MEYFHFTRSRQRLGLVTVALLSAALALSSCASAAQPSSSPPPTPAFFGAAAEQPARPLTVALGPRAVGTALLGIGLGVSLGLAIVWAALARERHRRTE